MLNIWRPLTHANNTTHIPVMLFIHGGCYTSGSGNLPLQGMITSSSSPVIVVSINYRLGVFGFLGGKEIQVIFL